MAASRSSQRSASRRRSCESSSSALFGCDWEELNGNTPAPLRLPRCGAERLLPRFAGIAAIRRCPRAAIGQREHRSVDPILVILVRANPKQVHATAAIANFELARRDAVDHFTRELFEIGYVDIRLDVPKAPAD